MYSVAGAATDGLWELEGGGRGGMEVGREGEGGGGMEVGREGEGGGGNGGI